MTVMVPCENAHKAGLRRVIDGEQVKKVIGVPTDQVSEICASRSAFVTSGSGGATTTDMRETS